MSKSSLFKDVNNIEDLKELIKSDMDYICTRTNCFMNEESLENAFQGLATFPEEQEKKLISFLKRVDKAFYSPGSYKGNAYHKYPIALAGLIYYRYYPDTISKLTLDEIVLLSSHSFVEPFSFYETAVDYYGKEMLSSIIAKTNNDTYDSMSIFMLADHMMKKTEKTKEETTEYIKETSATDLLEEHQQITIEMFKNVRLPW